MKHGLFTIDSNRDGSELQGRLQREVRANPAAPPWELPERGNPVGDKCLSILVVDVQIAAQSQACRRRPLPGRRWRFDSLCNMARAGAWETYYTAFRSTNVSFSTARLHNASSVAMIHAKLPVAFCDKARCCGPQNSPDDHGSSRQEWMLLTTLRNHPVGNDAGRQLSAGVSRDTQSCTVGRNFELSW